MGHREEIIKTLEKKIEALSVDKMFGILTRPGLEEKVSRVAPPFNAIFLDFNGVSKLNNEIGYDSVNEKFKTLFKTFKFRQTDLVGRWFSGDEIVIITKENEPVNIVERFEKAADNVGLKFKFQLFENIRNLGEITCST